MGSDVSVLDGAAMGLRSRRVSIGESTYPYFYGENCIGLLADEINKLEADRFVVVTDDTVLELHGEAFLHHLRDIAPVTVISHEPGEAMKSLPSLGEDIELALREGATRKSVVIAFGGGVPGNLAGVVAALLFRGVRLVHVPTSTIAAMDSVLSLKQAINSRVGKNQVGTYFTPVAVLTDVRLFATLPTRELRSGLCEMAKNCLAIHPGSLPGLRSVVESGEPASPESLLWLLDASINAKASVTAVDSWEQRTGLVLEYGHTVGHAIELLDHRKRGHEGLSHGESIALGMLVAARISHDRGWLSAEEVNLHDEIVSGLGMEMRVPEHVGTDDIVDIVRNDNKRGHLKVRGESVPYVLLRELGSPAMTGDVPLVEVELAEIRAALGSLRSSGSVATPVPTRAG